MSRPTPVTDLHVYGGALVMAIGLGMLFPWLGVAVFGLILLVLGLWSRP